MKSSNLSESIYPFHIYFRVRILNLQVFISFPTDWIMYYTSYTNPTQIKACVKEIRMYYTERIILFAPCKDQCKGQGLRPWPTLRHKY